MSHLRVPLVAVVFVLGAMGASTGCVDDDKYVTCSNFDDFLYDCYYNCASSFDCETRYQVLDEVSRQLLLDCSVCLQSQALADDCSDCVVQGWSCKGLMVDLLDGACEW